MKTTFILLPPLSHFEALPTMQALLGRGTSLAPGAHGELALASYVAAEVEALPMAALLRDAACHDAGTARWLCADVAHVEPDMTGVRMLACGNLDLSAEEADALAAALRPLLAEDGVEIFTTTPARWHLRLPGELALPAFDPPSDVIGDDLIYHLPQGAAGKYWCQRLNEVQILLHQHAVNAQRKAAGSMIANSLWFWGPGQLPAALSSTLGCVFSDDATLRVLAQAAGVRVAAPDRFEPRTVVADEALLDLGRTAASAATDVVQALFDDGHAGRLVLHFADGERWALQPGMLARLWHRWRR